jgi:hypothetical protein
MIITNEFKVIKTYDGIRALIAHHRPSIEVESYSEEPINLAPGQTHNIVSENGLILVSPDVIAITGDVTLNVEKCFICFAPLNITIVNDSGNEDNMEIRAYIF